MSAHSHLGAASVMFTLKNHYYYFFSCIIVKLRESKSKTFAVVVSTLESVKFWHPIRTFPKGSFCFINTFKVFT